MLNYIDQDWKEMIPHVYRINKDWMLILGLIDITMKFKIISDYAVLRFSIQIELKNIFWVIFFCDVFLATIFFSDKLLAGKT